jgi:hypothetical protein
MGSIFSALNTLVENNYNDEPSDSPSQKIFADHVDQSNPGSPVRKPRKDYIRQMFGLVEQWVDRKKGILKVTAAGSVIIGATVREIHIKLASPGVLNFTLGLAADRNGFPITIADLDGILGDYPATVARSGANTFQASDAGATSVTLDSPGMVTTFYPTADEDGYFRG